VYEIFFNPTTGKGQVSLGVFPGIEKISAFYVAHDAFFSRRVVVSTSSGRIFQIKFSPQAGIIRTVLVNLSDVTDIGGFFSDDDRNRHAIIANGDGDIQELFWAKSD
jgi:hypothetical protein